jgi:hypothetical protein
VLAFVGFVVVLVVVAVAAAAVAALIADRGATSNWSTYARAVATQVRRYVDPGAVVSEDDLASLPAPLAGYLRRARVVGRPRVSSMRVKFHGSIRADAGSDWMPFAGEQHSSFERPERLFFMRARRFAIPIDGLHVFRPGEASMRICLASLKTLADVRGPELVRSETVTFFNDMCLLAPAALIGAPVVWEPIDDTSVRGRYTLGAQTISATLHFDAAGDLVDFRSGDRYQDAGGANRLLPWSTPVERYREFGDGIRIPTSGSGWWGTGAARFAYLGIEIDDIAYNVGPSHAAVTAIPGWSAQGGDVNGGR